MQIYISKSEYTAICEAVDFITTNLSTATKECDDSYRETVSNLFKIINKLRRATHAE